MPEVYLTSKRVREPKEEDKDNTENKKKKDDDSTEFDSIVEHLEVVVEELESSNFSNIEEILEIYPTIDVECAICITVALVGSTKPVRSMQSSTKKYYKERKMAIHQNICLRDFHEELKKESFYLLFLSKLTLFRSTQEQQRP